MESLFFSLLNILRQLNKKLTLMLEVTGQHNSALRKNDMDQIKETINHLQVITQDINGLENGIAEIQGQLERKLQVPTGSTLSETLSYAPLNIKRELDKEAEGARQTTANIAKIIEINKILTRRAQQFNEQLINLLKPPAPPTYYSTGQTHAAKDSLSLIDKKI